MPMSDLLRHPTPDPPSQQYVRALCEHAGGQRQAARLLHYDERTMRRWCLGEREASWAPIELLRRMLVERQEST